MTTTCDNCGIATTCARELASPDGTQHFTLCGDVLCANEVIANKGEVLARTTRSGSSSTTTTTRNGVVYATSPAGRTQRCVNCALERADSVVSVGADLHLGVCASCECREALAHHWDTLNAMPSNAMIGVDSDEARAAVNSYSASGITSQLVNLYDQVKCEMAAQDATGNVDVLHATLDHYAHDLHTELLTLTDSNDVSRSQVRAFLMFARMASVNVSALSSSNAINGRKARCSVTGNAKRRYDSVALATHLFGMCVRYSTLADQPLRVLRGVRLLAFRQNFVSIYAQLALALASASAAKELLDEYVFSVRYVDESEAPAGDVLADDDMIGLSIRQRAAAAARVVRRGTGSVRVGYNTQRIEDSLFALFQTLETRRYATPAERAQSFMIGTQTRFEEVWNELDARSDLVMLNSGYDFRLLVSALMQVVKVVKSKQQQAKVSLPTQAQLARSRGAGNRDNMLAVAQELLGMFRYVMVRPSANKTATQFDVSARKADRLRKVQRDFGDMLVRLGKRTGTSDQSPNSLANAIEMVEQLLVFLRQRLQEASQRTTRPPPRGEDNDTDASSDFDNTVLTPESFAGSEVLAQALVGNDNNNDAQVEQVAAAAAAKNAQQYERLPIILVPLKNVDAPAPRTVTLVALDSTDSAVEADYDYDWDDSTSSGQQIDASLRDVARGVQRRVSGDVADSYELGAALLRVLCANNASKVDKAAPTIADLQARMSRTSVAKVRSNSFYKELAQALKRTFEDNTGKTLADYSAYELRQRTLPASLGAVKSALVRLYKRYATAAGSSFSLQTTEMRLALRGILTAYDQLPLDTSDRLACITLVYNVLKMALAPY